MYTQKGREKGSEEKRQMGRKSADAVQHEEKEKEEVLT
jgi:hypothetical protein